LLTYLSSEKMAIKLYKDDVILISADKVGGLLLLFDGGPLTIITTLLISVVIIAVITVVALACYYRRRMKTMTGRHSILIYYTAQADI